MSTTVTVRHESPICWIGLHRAEARNAVDRPTAEALAAAFRGFDSDETLKVAILHGDGDHFCAGADLKAVASGEPARTNRLAEDGDGPMGVTRLQLSKPVIAAVQGYCVAGGLELALWCDLRVAAEDAVFGVFCRRFGVPLIDGGTLRLPRLIGMSRALDMILTGRAVDAAEALNFGLVNRVVPAAGLLAAAGQLAASLAVFPQGCLRSDRRSAYEQWGMNESAALLNEFRLGLQILQSGESSRGAARFSGGSGRHGDFSQPQ